MKDATKYTEEQKQQVRKMQKLLQTLAVYEKQYPANMFKYPPEIAALTGGLFNGTPTGSK